MAIKGNAKLFTRISWCCLFSYFISELQGDGLWVCPQLISYSWWGCEYNMYLCWQKYTLTFLRKLMYMSHTTDRPGVSVGHPAGALAIICVWVLWHGWLTLMGCSVKMMLLLENSTHSMCVLLSICRIWQFNSSMFMIISDCYIIKRHFSHAWYGCWTTKALVEAEVVDGFTVICGGIAALLIIARPL
jgi:hypothetical protein